MIYNKDNQYVTVSDKFVYCDTIYIRYTNGISLLEEKYYSSNKPIKLKRKQLSNKKYFRFFELELAPEDYLISQGFKKVNK